jgi:hypothetical protein
LKYFVTNAVLVQHDGTEYKLNNYDLIDEFDKEKFSTIEAGNIPGAHYTKLKFYVGLDKKRNHEGAQDGDLDPLYNMIWSWNTGYIFLKHEGQLITPTNDTVVMQYHIATDDALRQIEVPIDLTVEGNPIQLNLQFDLNKIYNAPKVDINTQPIMHSGAGDRGIMNAVADNLSDAFIFVNNMVRLTPSSELKKGISNCSLPIFSSTTLKAFLSNCSSNDETVSSSGEKASSLENFAFNLCVESNKFLILSLNSFKLNGLLI